MANEVFAEAIERATLRGKSLDEIDAEIIEPAALARQQKGALLMCAYSLRRRGEQRRYAQESLTMTGMSLPGSSQRHHHGPLSKHRRGDRAPL